VDAGTATVLAALITGFLGLVGMLIKFWTENRRDHGKVMEVLNRIGVKLDRVDRRVTHHIDWHLQGGEHGQTAQGDSDASAKQGAKD
jgi:adenylosuccinate lyase